MWMFIISVNKVRSFSESFMRRFGHVSTVVWHYTPPIEHWQHMSFLTPYALVRVIDWACRHGLCGRTIVIGDP